MTPAERALFEAALSQDFDEMHSARKAVLLERLPEGFEQNLRQLCEREVLAIRTASEFASRHPLGEELRLRFRKEAREALDAEKKP